jgi:hypothetical protein
MADKGLDSKLRQFLKYLPEAKAECIRCGKKDGEVLVMTCLWSKGAFGRKLVGFLVVCNECQLVLDEYSIWELMETRVAY